MIIIKRGSISKKDGKTDESAAEPFAFPLCAFLATLFLKEGCIFEWYFMLIQ